MRFVIQRVANASVSVNNEIISKIGRGLMILVGISREDTPKDAKKLVNKALNMRLWPDKDDNPWKSNVQQNDFEILFVSQFTLYARMKGTKPDYSYAMTPNEAEKLYNQVLEMASTQYNKDKIFDGKFGAYMQVGLTNDGPVTICIDTDNDRPSKQAKDPNSNKAQKAKIRKEQTKQAKKEWKASQASKNNNNENRQDNNEENNENESKQ